MIEFEVVVPKNEVKIVKGLFQVASSYLTDFDESRILAEIFSKKLFLGLTNLTWNNGVQVIAHVVVTVEGTRMVKKTEKSHPEEIPATENVIIQTVPVQFENFIMKENKINFIMKVNEEERNDAVIIGRVPEGTIDNIKNPVISVEYPAKNLETEAFWKEIFKTAKKKASRDELIMWTFDVLKARGIFPLYGRDVIEVRKMFYYSVEYFPEFAAKPLEVRLDIFNQGIQLALHDVYKSTGILGRDILAKNIMRQLIRKNMHTIYKGRTLIETYLKRKGTVDIENIRFMSYVTPDGRRTSISPFDIWHEMAGYNDDEDKTR